MKLNQRIPTIKLVRAMYIIAGCFSFSTLVVYLANQQRAAGILAGLALFFAVWAWRISVAEE